MIPVTGDVDALQVHQIQNPLPAHLRYEERRYFHVLPLVEHVVPRKASVTEPPRHPAMGELLVGACPVVYQDDPQRPRVLRVQDLLHQRHRPPVEKGDLTLQLPPVHGRPAAVVGDRVHYFALDGKVLGALVRVEPFNVRA